MDDLWLYDDNVVADELLDALARVGVGDDREVEGVEEDAALEKGGGSVVGEVEFEVCACVSPEGGVRVDGQDVGLRDRSFCGKDEGESESERSGNVGFRRLADGSISHAGWKGQGMQSASSSAR